VHLDNRPVPRAGRREAEEWLVALIHDVDRTSSARYRELAKGLRAAIERGDVPVGVRLPPQRELAGLLSIGRTTVVSAYNLLRAESLLVTRQGAGTWVVRRPAPGVSVVRRNWIGASSDERLAAGS
jgi:DNA-binding FadR family transcriptional regulator